MDLVRGILLAIEEKEVLGGCSFEEVFGWLEDKEYVTSSDEDKDKVKGHCGILVDGGLVERCYDWMETHESRQDKWFYFGNTRVRLCLEGYEFLDNVRQDEVWQKVKDKIVSAGGTLSFEVVKMWVTEHSKSLVGL